MGTVYRKTYTKPLPADVELLTRKGERLARWKDTKGKTRTAPLTTGRDGSDRILVKAGTYTAKYRDGSGVVREKATGCRDKEAALRFLPSGNSRLLPLVCADGPSRRQPTCRNPEGQRESRPSTATPCYDRRGASSALVRGQVATAGRIWASFRAQGRGRCEAETRHLEGGAVDVRWDGSRH